ncbi:hypothetical protein [Aureimonas populi]|uniref:hypothetical protein n=1 Tax=Aureimonas populi TaxID=1701758 RepID=UPI001AE13F32|nr:hypothetical protein [Aureimonas populi]
MVTTVGRETFEPSAVLNTKPSSTSDQQAGARASRRVSSRLGAFRGLMIGLAICAVFWGFVAYLLLS